MTETFTASNGVEITITNKGDEEYLLGKGEDMPDGERRWTVATGGGEGIQALREFFQHERDKELGRWRDPENPDMVVQTDKGGERAWVVNERNQQITGWVWRVDLDHSTAHAQVVEAARAYFAAHPEPKPWHDAKPGDVWLLTFDGGEPRPVGVFDFDGTPHFSVPGAEDFSINYARITDGRRIWPEAS